MSPPWLMIIVMLVCLIGLAAPGDAQPEQRLAHCRAYSNEGLPTTAEPVPVSAQLSLSRRTAEPILDGELSMQIPFLVHAHKIELMSCNGASLPLGRSNYGLGADIITVPFTLDEGQLCASGLQLMLIQRPLVPPVIICNVSRLPFVP